MNRRGQTDVSGEDVAKMSDVAVALKPEANGSGVCSPTIFGAHAA